MVDARPLVRGGYDVIHVQNAQLFNIVYPASAASGARSVVSFRGFDTYVRPLIDEEWRQMLQSIYDKADILHFVSQAICDHAISHGAPAEKCVVIRCSVDTDYFSGLGFREAERVFRLCTVGRLTWEKAYPLALLVVRELKLRGVPVEYHVYGDGDERACLEHWIDRLEISELVRLRGAVRREELKEALLSSTIYFHPSVTEALGVAILEAQAMGLPVVATRVGGIHEAVVDGETGRLLPFGDVEGLADAIQELWESPGKRKSMGEAGRRWVEQRFSVEREAAEWVKLYKDLCSKRA